MNASANRPLGAYRVLELPGAVTAQLGKSFADLGADVVKVETTQGDAGRSLPPFAPDGTSLYWAAYNAGKRSLTADLDDESGRDLVRRLAARADVLIESYPPGWLDARGLAYDALAALNPALVLVSLTPYGQTGPFAQRAGADLIHFAQGGYMHMTGPPDGAPLKPSAPYQSWLHGCMQAFVATLLALRARRRSGRGTHVDQALRDTGPWMLTHTTQMWDLLRINLQRQGASRDMGGALRLPTVWSARDGYIVWMFQTGHIGGARVKQLVDWMAEHGMAEDWLRQIDWPAFDLLSAGPNANERLTSAFGAFFATKSKAELFAWALPRGQMIAPVQTLRDVAADTQLQARGVWREQTIGGRPARLPGPPVRLSEGTWEPRYASAAAPGCDTDAVLAEWLVPEPGASSKES
jgi:crotonobetainyl-CoA:carnitine CoA-transferase CaiB-like acyl-CoA transferase